MEENEIQVTIKRKSNRQAASNKKYNNSDSDGCDERERNYAKFVGENSDLDEDYEKSLKKNKGIYIVSDSSESESGDDQVRKKFKSKPGASKFVASPDKVGDLSDFKKQEKTSGLKITPKKSANLSDLPSTSSASSVRNPFFNRPNSIEKHFSSILQNSEEQEHENLEWMDVGEDSNEKDSNEKDSNEKDSNEKDSNEKDSNEKDSNKKESKIHSFFGKTGVSKPGVSTSIVNE